MRDTMNAEGRFESKVTRSFQITLPKKLREELGLHEGDYILFQKDGKKLVLVPALVRPPHFYFF